MWYCDDLYTIFTKRFNYNLILINTITTTFRWRLDQGKWADLLLDALPQFLSESLSHDWEFHIFGTGRYYEDLLELSRRYPQIKLYGRATRDQIQTVAQAWQYCLCPSTFLETFGLTALEWCTLWLPIIWPSKGWLEQFVLADIGTLRTQDRSESIISQLRHIDQDHDQYYHDRQQQTLNIAANFGPQKRLEQVNELINHSV